MSEETAPAEAPQVNASLAPYIGWMLRHLGEMAAVVAAFQAFLAAAASAKIDALIALLQVLKPILADFPFGMAALSEAEAITVLDEGKSKAAAAGLDWGMLLQIIEWILNLLGGKGGA